MLSQSRRLRHPIAFELDEYALCHAFPFLQSAKILLFLSGALLVTCSGVAQNYTAPSNPQLGSANTLGYCECARFRGQPPLRARCSCSPISTRGLQPQVLRLHSSVGLAAWAAVVLEADWSVEGGRQFDRTALRFGSAAPMFTSVPLRSPSHDVMRTGTPKSNLTDYTPLFTTPQGGRVDSTIW